MYQSTIYTCFFVIGWSYLRIFIRDDKLLCFAMAFITGSLLVAIFNLVIIALNVYSTSILLLGFSAFQVGSIIKIKKLGLKGDEFVQLVISITSFFCISFILVTFNFSQLSFDSFKLIMLGQAWSVNGGISHELGAYLGSWGAFLPLIHSLAPAFNLDYLSAFQPIFAISGVLVWLLLIDRMLKQDQGGLFKRYLIALGFVSVLLSSYFFGFQFFYIHNSMTTSIFLVLMVVSWWLYSKDKENKYLYICIFSIVGFLIQRTETPLVIAVFLVSALSISSQSSKTEYNVVYGISGIVCLWYLFLVMQLDGQSDILSWEKAVVLVLPIIFYSLILRFSEKSEYIRERYLPLLPYFMLSTAIVLLLVLFIYDFEHMMKSSNSVFGNLFATGKWQSYWYFVVFALAMSLLYKNIKNESYWTIFICTYVILIIAISIARIPYRIGWGDSANRMFTHLAPIITTYLLLKIGTSQLRFLEDAKFKKMQFIKKIVFTIFLTSGAFILFFVGSMNIPNILEDSKILSQPGWRSGYELNKIYDSDSKVNYASPFKTGEIEIVFQLNDQIQSGIMTIEEYSEKLKIIDWEISTSIDGISWQKAYANLSDPKLYEFDNRRYCVVINSNDEYQYVRIQFRKGLGQNRFLLRHLSLVAADGIGSSALSGLSLLASKLQNRCLEY